MEKPKTAAQSFHSRMISDTKMAKEFQEKKYIKNTSASSGALLLHRAANFLYYYRYYYCYYSYCYYYSALGKLIKLLHLFSNA